MMPPRTPGEPFLVGENAEGAGGLMSAGGSEKLGKFFFLSSLPWLLRCHSLLILFYSDFFLLLSLVASSSSPVSLSVGGRQCCSFPSLPLLMLCPVSLALITTSVLVTP